jgi:hypothetical protein
MDTDEAYLSVIGRRRRKLERTCEELLTVGEIP